MRIGFIGLGTMGYRIAKNISSKYKVNVWNRTLKVSEDHSIKYNTILYKCIKDLSINSDIILTCLPTSNEVNEVSKKIENNTMNNKYLIDCTSGNPIDTKRIGEFLKKKNIRMLDSPISGGPEKAEMGNLSSIIGGDINDYNYIKPILDSFSEPVYVGNLGSGHAVKAINNILNVSQLCLASEALDALSNNNVNIEKALEAISKSSGRSLMITERIPKDVINKKFNYGFKLGLMQKDVKIALEMIDNKIMFSNIEELMEEAVNKYGYDSDYTNISRLYNIFTTK
jgi:3-hydroxyisobutyrate dehydrogenase